MNCKKINDRIVCKFGSGLVTSTLPPMSQIPINIYTSKQCDWCEDAIDAVRRYTNPLKEAVNINVIDIEDCDDCDDIDILPTINIGQGIDSDRLVGVPRHDDIWASVFKHLGNS